MLKREATMNEIALTFEKAMKNLLTSYTVGGTCKRNRSQRETKNYMF